MSFTKIEVDVLCDWESPERYRLYLDGILMTERNYIWDNQVEFVREHMLVELPPGEHTLEIQAVNQYFSNFSLKNLTVNKVSASLKNNKFTV